MHTFMYEYMYVRMYVCVHAMLHVKVVMYMFTYSIHERKQQKQFLCVFKNIHTYVCT